MSQAICGGIRATWVYEADLGSFLHFSWVAQPLSAHAKRSESPQWR